MPSLIGRRITVHNIITQIDCDGLESTLNNFELSVPHAKAAIDYCIAFECKIDSEKHQFFDGCTLRVIADGEIFDRND